MTLYEAVKSGDVAAVKRELSAAKDVNELGAEGRTPLIEASAAGRADLVKLLLDAGAEPSWKDSMEETALLKAAANGHQAVMKLLWPHVGEEERATAQAFVRATSQASSPEFFGPDAPPTDPEEEPGAIHKKAVDIAARAANFFGHEAPLKRVERQNRAEDLKKKK